MNLTKLIIGTVLVIAGHAFLRFILNYQQEGLSVGSDAGLIILLPIEAIAYSIVVLLAFNVKKISVLVLVSGIMAIINFVVAAYGFLFIAIIIEAWFNTMSDVLKHLIPLSIVAIFGALLFCSILRLFSVTKILTLKMCYIIAFLCSFSAISAFFLDATIYEASVSVIINKTIWWTMFSLGIYISEQYSDKNIINKSVDI